MKLIDKIMGKVIRKYTREEIVEIKDIKIKPYYKPVSYKKLQEKRKFADKYNFYKEVVVIDKYNYLIDGYTTYLLAMEDGENDLLVTRFENETAK